MNLLIVFVKVITLLYIFATFAQIHYYVDSDLSAMVDGIIAAVRIVFKKKMHYCQYLRYICRSIFIS